MCWFILTASAVLSEAAGPVDRSPDAEQNLASLNRCGVYSLSVCATAVGRPLRESELERHFPTDGEELSLAELQRGAEQIGLSTLVVRWRGDPPDFDSTPAVIPIVNRFGRGHFLAILAARDGRVLVLDFPGRPRWMRSDFLRERLHWKGYALHIAPDMAVLDPLRVQMTDSRRLLLMFVAGSVVAALAGFAYIGRRSAYDKVCWRRSGPTSQARGGFTSLELLVSIGIIGLLLSLVLPAIQSSRESGRRMQCLNNLRQLGQACLNHESAHGSFPRTEIGFTNVRDRSRTRSISIHVRLLPFLDQGTLYASIDQEEDGSGEHNEPPTSTRNPDILTQRVPVFECPSDSAPAGSTNYRASHGTGPGYHSTSPLDEFAAKQGAFSVFGAVHAQRFKDGLANTVFFSEKLVGDRDPAVYTPWRDYFLSGGAFERPGDAETGCQLPANVNPQHLSFGGATWLLSGYDHTLYNHVLTPNSRTPDCMSGPGSGGAVTARSAHQGGVNIVLGDGSARLVADGIDLRVWRALSSRAGNEAVSFDF